VLVAHERVHPLAELGPRRQNGVLGDHHVALGRPADHVLVEDVAGARRFQVVLVVTVVVVVVRTTLLVGVCRASTSTSCRFVHGLRRLGGTGHEVDRRLEGRVLAVAACCASNVVAPCMLRIAVFVLAVAAAAAVASAPQTPTPARDKAPPRHGRAPSAPRPPLRGRFQVRAEEEAVVLVVFVVAVRLGQVGILREHLRLRRGLLRRLLRCSVRYTKDTPQQRLFRQKGTGKIGVQGGDGMGEGGIRGACRPSTQTNGTNVYRMHGAAPNDGM
jgi:hypothetical protein